MKLLRKINHLIKDQRGLVLPLILFTGLLFFIIAVALTQFSLNNYGAARKNLNDLNALYAAEAGGDDFMAHINQAPAYPGTNTVCPLSSSGSNPVTLYDDAIKGKGTYETCVVNGSIDNEKIVYAVGKIYQPATATKPIATRTIKLVIEGSQPLSYIAQTGPGGITLSNSATVTNGNIYTNGLLIMSGQAQVGSITTPANVWVANYNCPQPPDSTYPILCTSSQPISIVGQAHIYGNVSANYQTNTAGMSNPGLISNRGVNPVSLPDYDRTGQINAVTTTRTAASASCNNNETLTWEANTHITGGNVSITNNCIVTVNGNVWIDGNLTLKNKGTLKVGDNVNSFANIMIDGSNGLSLQEQSVVAANASNVGFEFVTFWSAASCSPNCSTVTGQDLANSQNKRTISISNQGLASESIFFARWTEVGVSNSGTIGALMGQMVSLSNSGNITFNNPIPSGGGSPTGTWDVRYYEKL